MPNTTAVTQETDWTYGPFKMQFQMNLQKPSDYRLDFKDKVLLQPMILGLLVFAGTDPVTKEEIPASAFERGFSTEMCRHALTEVGAAPLTRKCLVHKKVLRSIGDGDAKVDELHLMIHDGNDLATHALTQFGYAGNLLHAEIKKTKGPGPISEPDSIEIQQALANAKSHGAKFAVTGGIHLTNDDIIIVSEIQRRAKEVKKLKKKKKEHLRELTLEMKGWEILLAGKSVDSLKVSELDTLLSWYKAPKQKGAKRAKKLEQWKAILPQGQSPPQFGHWTAKDEATLTLYKTSRIKLKDDALNCLQQTNERVLEATVGNMCCEKRQMLQQQLDELDATQR